jgi:hypothetical protein
MEYFAEPEKGRVQASVIGNSEAVLMNVYETQMSNRAM